MRINKTSKNSIPIEKGALSRNNIRKVYKKRFYYSFLTIVLIVCFLQALRGAYLNVARYVTLNGKLQKLELIKKKATQKNNELKDQLKEYNSIEGIEAIARDNLKMVGKNEVLVIIKDSKTNQD